MVTQQAIGRQPTTVEDLKQVWPESVIDHVYRKEPFPVHAVGTAINNDDGRILLIFASETDDVRHFALETGQALSVINMLMNAITGSLEIGG